MKGERYGKGAILEDATKYKARIAALESMLRELEWSYWDDGEGYLCPECKSRRGIYEAPLDHALDCRLKALLEEK